MNNEVEFIEKDITDLMTSPTDTGLLNATSDDILYFAERADKYIEAIKKMCTAALKITTEHDWVLIGGKPYLQESGASKVARMFGISVKLLGEPKVETDKDGYKLYTYRARLIYQNQFIECEGSRSMKDDFFAKAGSGKPLKKPDEIAERDVKKSAYTNCLNNGIKELIPGLRNIDVKTLSDAGLDVSKISGYTFKDGSKGGAGKTAENSGLKCEKCGAAITQNVASFSQSKFGKMYCMKCQKEVEAATAGGEANV